MLFREANANAASDAGYGSGDSQAVPVNKSMCSGAFCPTESDREEAGSSTDMAEKVDETPESPLDDDMINMEHVVLGH